MEAYSAWRTSSTKRFRDFDGGFPAGQQFLAELALLGLGGQRTGEHGLGDAGNRGTEFEGGDDRPAAGALLAGGVHDDVNERLAGLGVNVAEDLGGDFDQEGGQLALVPLGEDLGLLGGLDAGTGAEQVEGFADDLHVGVFDAVVDHLDEVAGAVGADPGAAGLAVHLGGDLLEQRAEGLVGLLRAAGHDGGAVQRAFFAAGNADAHEVQVLLGQCGFAAAGVLVVRVAGVDDDVAGFQQRFKLLDDGVHRLAGLDHDQDAAGLLQGVDQLLQRFGADEVAVRAVLFEQCVGLFHGPVVQGNREAVAGQVAGQVGSHHRKAGDTDVCRHQNSNSLCAMDVQRAPRSLRSTLSRTDGSD